MDNRNLHDLRTQVIRLLHGQQQPLVLSDRLFFLLITDVFSFMRMVTDNASAIILMKENPSVIKRPLVWKGEKRFVLGYDEAEYKAFFRHELN